MTTDTMHHVILYGQSLSNGSAAGSVINGTALKPDRNRMFNAGVRTLGINTVSTDKDTVLPDANIATMTDLLEQTVSGAGETIASMMAYRVTQGTGASYLPTNEGVLVSGHGIGGCQYDYLKKGTVPYANILKGVSRGAALQCTYGRHDVMALAFIHGESDHDDDAATYQAKIEELQADLTEDLRKISWLKRPELPVFLCQFNSFTAYDLTESGVPFGQLQAALDNPGKIFMVGPKYYLQTATGGVHLTAESYAHLGSMYGEALRRIFALGWTTWLPLHMTAAVQTSNYIDVTFKIPINGVGYRDLVIDTTLISDPGDYGFRLIDDGDGNAPTITGFSITQNTPSNGYAQLCITFSEAPTGSNRMIGYADIGTSGADGGPTTGARGCIRDSTPQTDAQGRHLYNWAVAQRIAVTG